MGPGAPNDVAVGYSNKGGRIFNLLRDDLSHSAGVSEDSYEISYSRGRIPGQRPSLSERRGVYTVPVSAIVSVRLESEGLKKTLASEVSLAKENDEIVIFRFELDGDGVFVKGGVHSLQNSMRSWTNPLYESLTP